MAKCVSCSEGLPADAQYCLRCGAPQGAFAIPPPLLIPPEARASKSMSGATIALIVVGVAVGGIFLIAIIAAIAIPNLLAAKLSANETAAIATLRHLAACQAQMRTSGKQDADGDGIGEYGTLLELTGSVGLRTGRGGERGPVLSPPILSPILAAVDADGVVTKSGYAFVLFLPDPSGTLWVHEKGPAAAVALTGPVGADHAEKRWCAYAWPIARGNSGNRCFFVNENGDVLASENKVARHSGIKLPDPDCAVTGSDGDAWKILR